MSLLGKKVGQLKQWTAEKTGKAEKTDVGDDFKQMEQIADEKKDQLEKLATETKHYLQTSGKMKLIPTTSAKTHSMSTLGAQMTDCGATLMEISLYGRGLTKTGEAFEKVGQLQQETEAKMNDVFLQPLLQTIDGDLKDWLHQKKKLENRRLDYDAKNAKLKATTKGPTDVLESETNAARGKFEETLQACKELMVKIVQDNEESEFQQLLALVEAQKLYFEKSFEIFSQLQATLNDPNLKPKDEDGPVLPRGNTSTDFGRRESKIESRASSYAPIDDPQPPKAAEPEVARAPSTRAPVATPKPKPPKAEPKAEDRSSLIQSSAPPPAIPASPAASAPAAAAKPESKPRKKAAEKRIGLYPFVPENPDELPFQKGDVIVVLEKNDDGWWRGELNGRTGVFPSNYTAPAES